MFVDITFDEYSISTEVTINESFKYFFFLVFVENNDDFITKALMP